MDAICVIFFTLNKTDKNSIEKRTYINEITASRPEKRSLILSKTGKTR